MTTTTLISGPDGITPAWLTAALRSRGAIDADTKVASADTVSFGDQAGLMGALYRTTIGYEAGTGPETVVIKLPVTDPAQRGVADALAFHARECYFYTNLAPAMPIRVPECYGLAQDPGDSTDFVLIMEDLGGLERVDQVEGASERAVLTAADAAARFHAVHWDSPELETLDAVYPRLDGPLYRAVLPGVFETSWGPTKTHAGDLLSADVIAYGDRFAEHLPFLLTELGGPQATFLHGDFRGDNMMLDGDEVALLDFQISGIGRGPFDIGYLMSQSVKSDLRRQIEESVLDTYVNALAKAGVELDRDEAGRLYRLSLVLCIIYATTSFQAWDAFGERQHELMRTMLRRSSRAIDETGGLSLLP
ncbi:MAG: phosphotransferase [Acidimicrobiales bacterium]